MHHVVNQINKCNLIYHVAPFIRTDIWQKNLAQLLARLGQFNGKRVIAISTGPEMILPADVKNIFGKNRVEFMEVPNSITLRERASFTQLLEAIQSGDPTEATFYAHAKGVATAGDATAVMYWRNLMYHELLDDPTKIKQLLLRYPVIGCCRKTKEVTYPDGVTKSEWHFSGSFYWFRHDAWFNRSWRAIPNTGWAVEAAPGLLFRIGESYCVAKEEIKNPYDQRSYLFHERIADVNGAGTPDGLRLEIGGTHKLVNQNYKSVGIDDKTDIYYDFDKFNQSSILPFDTDSVSAIYCCHLIHRIEPLTHFMREILRICKVGAYLDFRVPHEYSNFALLAGHKQVISRGQVDHWIETALKHWWHGLGKRPYLIAHTPIAGPDFKRWKLMLPKASDKDILDLCPNAALENQWVFNIGTFDG
jgi:hypothetical protein